MVNFRSLFTKYVNGRAWLMARESRGIDIKKDSEDFFTNVQDTLEQLYGAMSLESKKEADAIMKVCNVFGAKKMKFTPKEVKPVV